MNLNLNNLEFNNFGDLINYNYNDIVSNGIQEYYAIMIADIEIDKVIELVNDIFENIILVNKNFVKLSYLFNNNSNINKINRAEIINVLSKLEFINKKYNSSIFIKTQTINKDKLIKKQLNYFKNLKKYIIKSNFYSEKSFCNFFTKLKESLESSIYKPAQGNQPRTIRKFVDDPKQTHLFNSEDDYLNESNYKIYKLKKDGDDDEISFNNLIIESKNDTLFYTDTLEKSIYLNNKFNNFHYVTHNSSINVSLNDKNSITNFDLLRSKFNVLLKNIYVKKFLPDNNNNWTITDLSIPSEFIDISISEFNDTFYNSYINNIQNYEYTMNDYYIPDLNDPQNFNNDQRKFNIKTMSIEYFIHDLESILFSQNIFYPWIDVKYSKRLKRLLLLYNIQNRVNIYTIIIINEIVNNMKLYVDALNDQNYPNRQNVMTTTINFFNQFFNEHLN